MRCQFVCVLNLEASPLLLSDVQKDICMISILGTRRGFHGPSISSGIFYRQHSPAVEVSGRSPALPSLPRQFGKFTRRSMIHPIHGNRARLLPFQENIHIDDSLRPRTPGTSSGEHGSPKPLVDIQVRKLQCHESCIASSFNFRNCAFTNSSGSSELLS